MVAALQKKYSLLKSRTFRWLFVFTGPILTFFYIFVRKPYGISLFKPSEQIAIAFYYSLPVILIWIFFLFLIQPILIKRLNVWNSFLYLAFIHTVIGFYYYVFSEVYIFGSMFDWYWLPKTLEVTYIQGLFVTLLWTGVHAGYLIRRRILRQKEKETERILEEISRAAGS